MNRERLLEEISKLDIQITDNQMEQIDSFCNFLIEYNKHTNLTAIKDIESIYLKHIYDSLTLVRVLNVYDEIVCECCEEISEKAEINSMLDIGSGAGFPGLIFKIVFPNIYVTLLDSNNKKTTFLKSAIEKLQLTEIEVINARAEDYLIEKRETFDLVTARAVASSDVLTELSLSFVKINGFLVLMKGNIDTSYENINYISHKLGGFISSIKEFQLPVEESKRTLVRITKKTPTPKEYPRRYDQIIKNPLKITNK